MKNTLSEVATLSASKSPFNRPNVIMSGVLNLAQRQQSIGSTFMRPSIGQSILAGNIQRLSLIG